MSCIDLVPPPTHTHTQWALSYHVQDIERLSALPAIRSDIQHFLNHSNLCVLCLIVDKLY